MCVLALAWRSHPRWRLVVAANRDEFHDRPSEPLHRWGNDAIIAGRDARGRGTWLAVSESGRFAAVTNLRGGPQGARPASRGTLVVDLAAGRPTGHNLDDFGPFNAISTFEDEAAVLSNRSTPARHPLAPGLYGMSNEAFATPAPKTLRLKAIVRDWLEADGVAEQLFAGLREPTPPSNSKNKSASIFVHDATYGTRCSTLVLVDQRGSGTILERRYDRAGDQNGDTEILFAWP